MNETIEATRPGPTAVPPPPLLSINNIEVVYDDVILVLRGLSLEVPKGAIVALLGANGAGKSTTLKAISGLLKTEDGEVTRGEILFEGRNLLDLTAADMLKVRGQRIGMIFQDPMTALNPHLRIGTQLAEVLVAHRGQSWQAAMSESARMLQAVHMPAAAQRLQQYPHELSGGQRQRVMIAMALLCRPQLLIADEPTTALDVTVQAQILRLMAELRREFGLSMILITHDLGVMAQICERAMVMYGGQMMEQGPCHALLTRPGHPYTRALVASRPRLDGDLDRELSVIAGAPPTATDRISGCPFAPRCQQVEDICRVQKPVLRSRSGGQLACHVVTV